MKFIRLILLHFLAYLVSVLAFPQIIFAETGHGPLYSSLDQSSDFDSDKVPRDDSRRPVHISNINRFAAAESKELLHGSKSKVDPAWGIDVSVKAEAAILMNADTGAILYEKNSRGLYYPASITKIATAMVTLQQAGDRLDEVVIADQECIGWVSEEAKRRSNYAMPSYRLVPGSSHIGIKKGEMLSLRDLLYGMMLASGDDASNVIAQHVAGSIPQFMQDTNAYLQKIGCLSTTFQNPHGLHHPKHQTTAYDMAVLTREALKDPRFCEIVSTVKYTRPKTNKQEASTLVQSNRLLRSGEYYYPKAIGVKTGHLSISANTFVGAARDGDRTLIAVLLKSDERKDIFLDSVKLFEAAFSQPKVQRTLLHRGPQKFLLTLEDAVAPIETYLVEDVVIDYYPAEEPKFKCMLSWDPSVKLPVAVGQRVGELQLVFEDSTVKRRLPLYAKEEAQPTWSFWMKSIFGASLWLKALGGAILCAFLGFFAIQLGR
jgi:D-alanyl-D-alanine carboxypeptidase (penicillin-binding protein 5/6)